MRHKLSNNSGFKILQQGSEAAKIALFYGFLPIWPPKIIKEDFGATQEFGAEWHPAEKAALLRTFLGQKGAALPQPLMLFCEKKKPGRVECELSILGSNKSICEVLLIQTARTILENAGWKETSARLNSVGSKESIAEFERKMTIFIRKRMADFPSELRQNLKKDLYFLTKSRESKYKEWQEMAPQSVDYLSEESRLHLKELLEFMETINLPYTMDASLLGDLKYAAETVFEIIPDGQTSALARGFRWNRLSKKIDNKKEVPAASIHLSAKTFRPQKFSALKKTEPKFYLVQFGPEAKQKSFLVLEKLRKAGIAVSHSLAKDKLTGQIFSAEQGGLPFIILIGQKEALENVVVVRNTVSRVQYTVPIENLGEFIKKSNEFK